MTGGWFARTAAGQFCCVPNRRNLLGAVPGGMVRSGMGRGVGRGSLGCAVLALALLVTGCATAPGGPSSGPASRSGTVSAPPPADRVEEVLRILTYPAGTPGAVDTFWRGQLGAAWTPVRLVPYRDGQVPADACGVADRNPAHYRSNAAFCTLDGTVAYSRDLLNYLYQQGGPYLPVVVLEHEYGHRANTLAGWAGTTSLYEEDQADCEAGASTRFARDAGRLPVGDVVKAAELFYSLGDRGVPFFNREANRPNAHGKPAERVASFLAGYRGEPKYGLRPCRKIATGSSPYRLAVLPGS